MTTEFFSFIVVIPPVEFVCACRWVPAFGDLNLGNLEVVLRLAGCVRSEEEAVCCVRFIFIAVWFKSKDCRFESNS